MEGITLRPARHGDGRSVFEVTRRSIAALANGCYSEAQLRGWMGERTAVFYEDLIANGRMVVAEQAGHIVGFVDAEPGEVTRLFLLESVAGEGLGRRLLEVGLAQAGAGGAAVIRVESTLNAKGFYQRHGFVERQQGVFSHGVGGEPIAVVHMELRLPPVSPTS